MSSQDRATRHSDSHQLTEKCMILYSHGVQLCHFQILSKYAVLNVSSLKQADEQNPALSEKARLHLEKYSFPVEMMVALPNGTIVSVSLF